jgi:hypothetical protein
MARSGRRTGNGSTSSKMLTDVEETTARSAMERPKNWLPLYVTHFNFFIVPLNFRLIQFCYVYFITK